MDIDHIITYPMIYMVLLYLQGLTKNIIDWKVYHFYWDTLYNYFILYIKICIYGLFRADVEFIRQEFLPYLFALFTILFPIKNGINWNRIYCRLLSFIILIIVIVEGIQFT